ncbi:SigE family RNA polymerase sigma factor [Actinoallomurus sp. CA-150999]|uniref:SigE family RNA polymerase sigma factor n=1 Tax=Actinoallomurus sp. CA-150999 TaxID=3239887 RepID=UPI003D8F5E27
MEIETLGTANGPPSRRRDPAEDPNDSPDSRQPQDTAAVFTTLFREHQLEMVRVALLIVGDRASAEDVVQDAFTALHGKLDRLDDPDRALPYIRTSVINGCRTVLRRRRLAWRMVKTYDPPVWSAESAALLGEERREVMAALGRLPRRQREAIVLRYYLDLGEAEIAEAMGISRGTVKSTISRGIGALTRKLAELGETS